MKILKGILFFLVVLIILFLAVALFLPSTSHVERSITINLPADSIYALVVDYNYYQDWNPWSKMEPTAKGEISGPVGQAGQKWSWEGEIIGSGSLTTEKIIPGEYIESKLEFTAPQAMQSKDIWKFESTQAGSKITWINEAELGYPVERYFGLFMDNMLGGEFESGLVNLKMLAENKYQTN
ncbi:MAG: SRPBCC family protein [Calditrichaceae bacterium]|nr:SRPBCC family protein [Calditrichaceae bacterium]